MPTFKLTANEGTLTLQGDRSSTSRPYEPWEYVAEVRTTSLSARVEVYDHLPNRFREFFEGLAGDWKGWTGERSYESLEPMLRLSVEHDGKGFALFTVLLRAGAAEDFGWSVSQRLSVELGQLSGIAEAAGQFANMEAQVVV
jgi:hypothetical protein